MRLRHGWQKACKRECADQRDRPDQHQQQPILFCRKKGGHSVALLLPAILLGRPEKVIPLEDEYSVSGGAGEAGQS
ncbi:hypothetical protein NKH82_04190 [Mesorhizobium sp. M0915]|uniref:hypothetical protein n=1 Tax=Mesorhizobium sp. M0915 TaxID=2957027 RepID=UPI00333D21EB